MPISIIISVNKNIVQIYNIKDVKFFDKNHTDMSLEACQGDHQFERHHLIFKVDGSNLEYHFLFVFFASFHLIICISKVKLDKPLNASQLI